LIFHIQFSFSFVLRVEGHEHTIILRETMSHADVLAHPSGECRESQIPQAFGLRQKSAKPL